jgi:hypothetical protein
MASCASRVRAAFVASRLRSSVGVEDGVQVGEVTRVGKAVDVAVCETMKACVCVEVCTCSKVGKGVFVRMRSGVAVRLSKFSRKGVFVRVGSPAGGRVTAGPGI